MIPQHTYALLVPQAGILAALVLAVPSAQAQQSSPFTVSPEAQRQQLLALSSPSAVPPEAQWQLLASLAPYPPGQKEKTRTPDTLTHEQQTGTSNERLFWVIPDFLLIENAKRLPPLSVGAKFKVVARSSFDWVNYPVTGMQAGLSQAENSEPGYGRGAAGYGKRYGSAFADGTIEGFMTGAVLPSILRQDPRYYQLGKGGLWRRSGYAISRIFVTLADSGRMQFNASEIVGAALAGGISTYSYHPRDERTVRNSLSVWGTQVGYDTIGSVFNEFWPDIHRHFSKR